MRIAVDPVREDTKTFIKNLTPLLAIMGVGLLEDDGNLIACDVLGEMFSIMAVALHSVDRESKSNMRHRLDNVLMRYANIINREHLDDLYTYDLASDVVEDAIDFYYLYIDKVIDDVKKHGLHNVHVPVDFIVSVNFETLTITVLAEIDDANFATHNKG